MITKIFDEQGWELKQPLISFITVERNAEIRSFDAVLIWWEGFNPGPITLFLGYGEHRRCHRHKQAKDKFCPLGDK